MHHDDLGKRLLDCLKEVSSLLDHAINVATKQQSALVKNDAEAIVLTTRAQEEVLRRIDESDQRAASVAGKLAEEAGLAMDSADSGSVADAAGYPYSSLIKAELENISGLADRVQRENKVCKALLNNGLDIITTCIRTLANDPGPSAYSRDAAMAEPQALVLSLDIKA